MKSSTFTAVLLTLVMLLLVAVAAFAFLFSRQRTLVQRAETLTAESDTLRQEAAETGLALAAAVGTREALAGALATAQANEIALEGELVQSDEETAVLQTERDELASQLADATDSLAQLEIENERLKAPFPFVKVVTPADAAILPPEEPVDILVLVYDPVGLAAVNITLDGETTGYDGHDEPLFIHRQSWQPDGTGEHSISVLAINVNGRSNDPQETTFQLIDIDVLNAEIRAAIETAVIDLTGLTPLEPIELTLLTRDQLSVRIEADFANAVTPEDTRRDLLVLQAFDFVEPDFDLYAALVELYSQGVLGFYDAQTAEFVVVSDDEELDYDEELTHAHEFVHALQDQYYELDLLNEAGLDNEAAAAVRALAEGHATLIEGLYLASSDIPPEAVTDIAQQIEDASGQFDDLPPFLLDDIMFPYTAGFEFAMALYEEDGLAAIDAAWDDLPQSTEHILHPDRYMAGDVPQVVTLPPLTGTLGVGWQLLEQDMFGEFYLRQYLSQQLDENSVDVAATGWGGDQYAVYWNEADEAVTMVLRLAWDSAQDEAEFQAIFPQYSAYLFETTNEAHPPGLDCVVGPDDVICLGQVASDSLIVRAPDVDTAVRVFEQFPDRVGD